MNKKLMIRLGLFGLLVASVLVGCDRDETVPTPVYQTRKAVDVDGRMAHEWVELGYQIIRENFLFGPYAARAYGYIGLTLHEAAVNGIPNGRSLAGQINDLPEMPLVDENQEYDWGVVVCAAMKTVLPQVIDNASIQQRSTINALADLQEANMVAQAPMTFEIREASRAFGNKIGEKIVERAKTDGRDIIRSITPQLPERDAAHPWYWDRTTFGQQPVEPMWSLVSTFVLPNSQGCEIDPPFVYSTEIGSDFYKEAQEVYDFSKNGSLSAQNRAIAYHWENGPGRTCSPACHWVSITEQVLQREGWDLGRSAQAYALVGMTAADAFSVAWFLKYKYNLMRPATFIREQIDPNWKAPLGTPPYPDYISGSSTVGGAVPLVLISLFGDGGFSDHTHQGSPLYTPDGGPFVLPDRVFSSFTAAGKEQKESRILGGVHFRRACDLGYVSGQCIGSTVLSKIELTK